MFDLSSTEEKTGHISIHDFNRLLPKAPQMESRVVTLSEPVEVCSVMCEGVSESEVGGCDGGGCEG